MKVGMFAALLPPAKGRPSANAAEAKGAGQPPWLSRSPEEAAERRKLLRVLSANLRQVPQVRRLPEADKRKLVRLVLIALDTWRTTKDAPWHEPKVPIGGALEIAACSAGESIFRPEWQPKRGRKPNVADVRFLIECALACGTVGLNSKLWRVWGPSARSGGKNNRPSVVLPKPLVTTLADKAWQALGRNVPDTTWPGLIDNARKAGF